MINLSFFFFLLSCLVSSRLSRTLSRDSKTWTQRERRFWGIFFLLMSRFFTQERSMTTTWPTWRETWTPSGISRSSARSCGWRTSNSWTAISRNWRNSLFEETTRSSSPNTWVWSNNDVYSVALYKKQLQNLSSEIKRVVVRCFLERINRISDLSPSLPRSQKTFRNHRHSSSSKIYRYPPSSWKLLFHFRWRTPDPFVSIRWISYKYRVYRSFSAQDTLLKVKGVMVDEKRHIRFADWSATDVSQSI